MTRPPSAELYRLAEAAVQCLRRIPAGLSGDDSPLTDFWLEYAAQVQEEHGFMFGEYERLVRAECDRRADGLSPTDLESLWPATEGAWEWTEDGLPALSERREHIGDELFRLVRNSAANLELPT